MEVTSCRGFRQFRIIGTLVRRKAETPFLRRRKLSIVPLAALALMILSPRSWADRGRKLAETERVWEDSMTIPTSEEGPPDPNPPFDLFNTGRFLNYPYTLRHNLVDRRIPQKWRTLNLENEYLKCAVLPSTPRANRKKAN
jgi:hypothetical protein